MCLTQCFHISKHSKNSTTKKRVLCVYEHVCVCVPRFVSALLRVQQLRLSQEVNGGVSGEAGRGRQWVWGQKRRDEESSASMVGVCT